MIRRFGFLCAALAAGVLGKDITQPVKRNTLEFASGVSYTESPGNFDANGKFVGYPSSYRPGAYGIPLQVKYGLGAGIDLKATWSAAFTNEDAGSLQGMGQPTLGAKYAWSRGGVFSNLILPYATGDWDDRRLYTTLEAGGILRERWTRFRFTGLASYLEVFDAGDVLRLSAQPEILWGRRSAYLSLEYLQSLSKDAYLLALIPGFRTDISKTLFCDASFPLTVAGRSAPAVWQLSMKVYWTLKL